MTRSEIVEQLARERRVEQICRNTVKAPLTGELKDLCQMTYLALLEFDEDKVVDLWDKGQINFFIARVILNQWQSTHSPFYYAFRRLQRKTVQLEDYVRLTDDE